MSLYPSLWFSAVLLLGWIIFFAGWTWDMISLTTGYDLFLFLELPRKFKLRIPLGNLFFPFFSKKNVLLGFLVEKPAVRALRFISSVEVCVVFAEGCTFSLSGSSWQMLHSHVLQV